MAEHLASWNDTPTTQAIVDFVESAASGVPLEERVATFDNDGTLWCEKPMPIQLDFTLRRLAAMAEEDESLRGEQPWKAAYEKDLKWLGAAVAKHYQGDDSDVKKLLVAVPQAFAGLTVEEYDARVTESFADARHPTLARTYDTCGYQPMVELLRYLEANGFTCYIASGGDRDFMRPIAGHLYGIPRERVIGSSFSLEYQETRTAPPSSTSPRWSSSTTGRRSRCGSGAGSDAGRSSPAATRTATSRCCASRGLPSARRSDYSSSTTTPSASSPTRPAPSRLSSGRASGTGPS